MVARTHLFGRGRVFSIAAIAVVTCVLFALLIATSVAVSIAGGPQAPDRPQWAVNQSAFETLTLNLPPAPDMHSEWVQFEIPERVGDYEMQAVAFRTHEGAIFYDTVGSGMLDDAGIAYLPNGPDQSLENGSFESPDFKHLNGPWYSWAASW